MQQLRLMESPLVQEVIILSVSRKLSCAIKTKSYNDDGNDDVDNNDNNNKKFYSLFVC